MTASQVCVSPLNLPKYDLDNVKADDHQAIAKGGVACPFPWRVHECLAAVEKEGLEHIVSWAPHGRAFTVYKPREFVDLIMPRFFGQSKYASFQRQLNLYGFSRFAHGKDKGAYYHECFIRGDRCLVRNMVRRKIKGNKVRKTLRPEEEPNFYLLPFSASSTPSPSFRASQVVSPVTSPFGSPSGATVSRSSIVSLGSLSDALTPAPLTQLKNTVFEPITHDDVSLDLEDGDSLWEIEPDHMKHQNEQNSSSSLLKELEPTPIRQSLDSHFTLVDPVKNVYRLM